jgi:hypothetical protein
MVFVDIAFKNKSNQWQTIKSAGTNTVIFWQQQEKMLTPLHFDPTRKEIEHSKPIDLSYNP